MNDFAFKKDTVPLTPDIRKRLERRAKRVDNDEDIRRVVKDAAKHGVDWSHLMEKA